MVGQTVEAVIISGDRRGEIIELPEPLVEEITDEELELLNSTLDRIIAALDRLNDSYVAGTEALKRSEGKYDAA